MDFWKYCCNFCLNFMLKRVRPIRPINSVNSGNHVKSVNHVNSAAFGTVLPPSLMAMFIIIHCYICLSSAVDNVKLHLFGISISHGRRILHSLLGK